MRVNKISFNEKEWPQEITVTMTVGEAALLVKHCGRQSLLSANECYEATNALYDALTGMVFNAYYENGVDDYLQGEGTS